MAVRILALLEFCAGFKALTLFSRAIFLAICLCAVSQMMGQEGVGIELEIVMEPNQSLRQGGF